MKRMTRILVTAAGFVALAGAPSMFGAEFHSEHARYEHERYEHARMIRLDRERVRRDLARGDYRAADRDRAILRQDEHWR